MKKVLLHICCGPCAISPFEILKRQGYFVEGFFYNPNIQPQSEYLKRRQAVEDFANIFNEKVCLGDYQEDLYLEYTKSAKDRVSRCRQCFKLRLTNTHQFALDNKFDFFTTTLLVSPYQDQRVIKEIASEIVQDSRAQFLFCDFRPSFRQGHTKAKELNLYCQKYCGCLSSLKEREEKKKSNEAQTYGTKCPPKLF